ncbi:hypothetical protein Gohar_009947 [Gossypium harknessii]|uniref:Uncharacterized protein n=1 Tax=Gossypium harknessii TaxID=34285 RepID=A0A7J9GQ20_9ROSI|nr:hypothetical protein [Gossypium harknessii]
MDFRRAEFKGDSLLVITKIKSTATNRSDISMLIWKARLVKDGSVTIHGVVYVESLHVGHVISPQSLMVAGTSTSDLGYWPGPSGPLSSLLP